MTANHQGDGAIMELQTLVFEGTRPGPHLLITGGVHGDEFIPMATLRRLAAELRSLELAGQVTLVPVVNEAAFLRGHRMAEDELDLARTCPGREDGSVTERTAHALSRLICTADFYIDLHTGSIDLALLPMSGYTLHPDDTILEQQRQMARAFGLPVIWGTSPDLNGRSLSVARDAGIPAIYAEYGGSAQCDPAGVAAYYQGCLNVMAWLKLISRPLAEAESPLVVEDPRSGAGHMQRHNPAPWTGFYEPCVQPGDAIREGESLGTLSDITGVKVVEIPADRSGIVLGVRTFSRALEGEFLAVILETEPATAD